LLGKNGSGKTTLIKHFNGLYRPLNGEIKFKGQSILGKTPVQLAQMVGLSFQNPNDQFFKSRVEDELRVGLQLMQEEPEDWMERICRLFQLHDLMGRSPFKLSEGEKKRVAISSILAMKPEIVILDEPSAGQDGRSKQMLATILAKLIHEGLTTICVTHDIEFARAVADRWIVIDQGQIKGDGPPESFEQLETFFNPTTKLFKCMKPLDPRTKLLIGIVIIASVFIAENPVSIFCQLGIILVSVFLFRLSAPFFRSLRLIIPMVGLVFLVSWISYNHYTAFLLCVRLFNLLASSFLNFSAYSSRRSGCSSQKNENTFWFCFHAHHSRKICAVDAK
jgi:energy-coupling factor transporter ATP-binding protein EcfA2